MSTKMYIAYICLGVVLLIFGFVYVSGGIQGVLENRTKARIQKKG